MITFKGITASTNKVVINKLPPFVSAGHKTKTYDIEGFDGSKVEKLGLQSYVLPMVFTVTDLSKLESVKSWLIGSGQLIRDDDSDKFVNAVVLSEVSFQKNKTVLEGSCEFYIQDPFRYYISESDVVVTTPQNLLNVGTYHSLPLLHITGSGIVEITIGDYTFGYNFGSDTEVYIDSQLQEAYLGSVLKNRKMTGVFPVLEVGTNAISWTGTITSIVVTQRTRFI